MTVHTDELPALINKWDKVLPIIEISIVLQGEGPLTGVPHFLIRTTGCPMRCCWGDVPCDTWYTSHKPEKGKFTLKDIDGVFNKHPHITHMFLTGGSPTMHQYLVADIVTLCMNYNITTTLETEGAIATETAFDYISLSPKLSSSQPTVGLYIKELDRELSQKDKDRHNKYRTNYSAMRATLQMSNIHSYVKFVVSKPEDIVEIEMIVEELELKSNEVWLMPMGANRADLERRRLFVSEVCIQNGYNYTDRLHIIIHGDKRGV